MKSAGRAAVALASAGLACAGSRPARRPEEAAHPIATVSEKAKSRAPILLSGEEPRLVVYEFPRFCGKEPILLFAIFDTRVAYRLGDPCTIGDRAYRVVALRKEDWDWVMERIDINPLIVGAPPEVDYCPKCIGGRHFFLAMKKADGRFGGGKLHNPCSGNPSEAEFPTANERYGAEAAEGLICSLDRLVDALATKFPPPRSQPWPKGEPIFREPQKPSPGSSIH